MAAQHLAATKIQGAIRKFLYRKHRDIIRAAKRANKPIPYYLLIPAQTRKLMLALAGNKEMQSFSASQQLRQKFVTSPFNDVERSEEDCMRDFCASLIQSTYKMSLTRRLFKYHRFAMYHIAAIQI
jgi:hypothetical protein